MEPYPIYYIPSELEDRIYPDKNVEHERLRNHWEDLTSFCRLERPVYNGHDPDSPFPVQVRFCRDTHHLEIIPEFDTIDSVTLTENTGYKLLEFEDSYVLSNNSHTAKKTFIVYKNHR